MSVSVRQLINQRIDPVYRPQPRPAGAPSIAGPQDLLGAPPRRQVDYQTDTARALLSAEAAQLEVDYSLPPPVSGGRFDATA